MWWSHPFIVILVPRWVPSTKNRSRELSIYVWEMVKHKTRGFLRRISHLFTGRTTNNDSNFRAKWNYPPPLRLGHDLTKNTSFLDRLEKNHFVSFCFYGRLRGKLFITSATKWMGFFCDHVFSFSFPEIDSSSHIHLVFICSSPPTFFEKPVTLQFSW